MKRVIALTLTLFFAVMICFNGQALTANATSMVSQNSEIDGIVVTQINAGSGQTGGIMLDAGMLSTTDLSGATYLAIEYYNPTGAAWPFFFICQQNQNFIYLTEGESYYRYSTDWQLYGEAKVQYHALAPTVSSSGYIVLPLTLFQGISQVEALYITIPADQANQVNITTLHFGKILYTSSEQPDFSQANILVDFTKKLDVDIMLRQTNPNYVSVTRAVSARYVDSLVSSEINGISLKQRALQADGAYGEGGILINRFEVGGDDISNMEYIALEYYNPTGAPWPFVFKIQDDNNYMIHTNNPNAEYYLLDSKFNLVSAQTSPYGYVAPGVATSGWIVLPREIFGGGQDLSDKLLAMYILLPCHAENQNGITELHFGNIKIINRGDDVSEGVLASSFNSWSDADIAARVIGANAAADGKEIVSVTRCAVKIQKEFKFDFGDVRILEDFETDYPENEQEYNEMMSGKIYDAVGGVTVSRYTQSSASQNALKFTIVQPKDTRPDDYAGVTFTPKTSVYQWGVWKDEEHKALGVTFWVKNLSSVPVVIAFEIDEFDPYQNVSVDGRGERWSLKNGGRIMLYDTVESKQYLVQSSPFFAIPAGFEGWVRIPFSSFGKALWCTWGNSTFDRERIAQVTIACNTIQNMGLSFAMDSIGLYYNNTVIKSMFIDNGNSIWDNMRGE